MGFTPSQLYSTATYKIRDLRNIGLSNLNLADANFTNQFMIFANLAGSNLTGAVFRNANLGGTDFSFADLRRAASWSPAGSTVVRNTIRPDGGIWGLEMTAGEMLAVRNLDMAITITQEMTLAEEATLRFVFDDQPWGSTVHIADGLVPQLDGVLELIIADGVDSASLLGTTFKLFDWNDTLTAGQVFSDITTLPELTWDTANLYTTGEVTLIPEPGTLSLMLVGVVSLLNKRKRKQGE